MPINNNVHLQLEDEAQFQNEAYQGEKFPKLVGQKGIISNSNLIPSKYLFIEIVSLKFQI